MEAGMFMHRVCHSQLKRARLSGHVALLAIAVASLFAAQAMSAEPRPIASEIRDFEILVDNAKAGTSKVTITDYDDGRSLAATSADVKLTILLYTYVYQFNGSEEWLDDQLRRLDSRAIDGPKKLSLKAQVDSERTVLQGADGKMRNTTTHAMTTNYWRQPPDELQGKKIAVLDADNGKTLQLKFENVGPKTLTLLGKPCPCQHFKATGDLEVELWYDGSGRLVRQVGTEDGRKTEIRLTGYRQSRTERR